MTFVYKNKEQLIQNHVMRKDTVLDVGFWGQGVQATDPQWPHALLRQRAGELYGIDLDLDESMLGDRHYKRASAEDFDLLPMKFDIIFAGDLIEHLSNPGLFLQNCRRHLKSGGRLILTTPNAFNLFNMAEKLTKREPTVNSDHTCYFNGKTIRVLLRKNGMEIEELGFLYTLGIPFKESFKKKVLNGIYWALSLVTDKFTETLVVIASAS